MYWIIIYKCILLTKSNCWFITHKLLQPPKTCSIMKWLETFCSLFDRDGWHMNPFISDRKSMSCYSLNVLTRPLRVGSQSTAGWPSSWPTNLRLHSDSGLPASPPSVWSLCLTNFRVQSGISSSLRFLSSHWIHLSTVHTNAHKAPFCF